MFFIYIYLEIDSCCSFNVSPKPIIRKARKVGYIIKKTECTEVNDNPSANIICNPAVTMIPIVPMAKNGWSFFIISLFYDFSKI